MINPKYPHYAEYKDSNIEWLERVPKHWDIKKLKTFALVFPSNVDKKSKEGEVPVKLCNYTDVYYNDRITNSIEFMTATATSEQILKFLLKAGDTLITKDSEDPDDIAIPSYVPEDIEGVICGYHLAIVRPHNFKNGSYIKRVFESHYAKAYFSTRANGLTRYGLGTYALANVYFPIPPISEAQAIANFLDHETAKIDTLIEKQQQLIKLLKEKRQAVISHAVTKGLNPNAPMRDSGVEWLGEVPAHWIVGRYKFCTNRVVVGIAEAATHAYADTGIPIIRSTNIREEGLDTSGMLFIKEEFAEKNDSKYLYANDVITVRTGYPGISAVIPQDLDRSQCFTNLVASPRKNMVSEFLAEYLNSHTGKSYFDLLGWGSAQKNISVPILQNVPIAYPDEDEQAIIVKFVKEQRNRYTHLVEKAELQIQLLQERRTALISAAVTGKIDVRNWQAPSQTLDEKIAA